MKTKKIIFFALKCMAYIFLICILTISISLKKLNIWFLKQFSIGIQEILFTIKSPLNGANTNFLQDALTFINIRQLFLIICFIIVIIVFFELFFSHYTASVIIRTNKRIILKIDFYLIGFLFLFIGDTFLFFRTVSITNKTLKISEYIKQTKEQTRIFEESYIKPTFKNVCGKGKNLIYIYVESLETTYSSKEKGGAQEFINYIPNLTKLAEENISFSQTEKLGGFHCCTGAGWTMGALFTTFTGVPFKFPVNGNDMNLRTNFASGITTLGDVLAEKGYVQEFLCGSDGNFAGRKQFFEQHGNFIVYDLFTAREKDYIPEDYMVWWGFEDEILFRIGKDEILSLVDTKKPFNLTMLTVDTHHVGGYKCNLCEDKYPENLGNVIDCTDRQIYNFVQWCKQQDFYENTVIVISGDHPRMDSILVDGVSYDDRMVYNCFINSAKGNDLSYKNREFCSVDMFPTVLSAMGFEIKESRLGIGTDMFSGIKTYSEEMGYSEFNNELSKFSKYYIDNFS